MGAFVPSVLHTVYGTVAPPREGFPQNEKHVQVTSIVLLAVCLTSVGISVGESRRQKSTVPAALTVGAITCVLAEAINCYLANVLWTVSDKPGQVLFTLLGREFEWYVVIIWWAFGSVMSCGVYAALSRNVSTRTLWVLLGLAAFFDFVLEEVMLNYGGVYSYYGHQPLILFKLFPVWWMFGNTSGIFAGIAVTYRYRHLLNGWQSIVLLPILPFCYVGPQVLAGMPTIYAIQSNQTDLVTQMCGIATCCIGVVQTGVIMDAFLGRDPLDWSGLAMDKKQNSHQKKA